MNYLTLSKQVSTDIDMDKYYTIKGIIAKPKSIPISNSVSVLTSSRSIYKTIRELILVLSQIKSGEYLPYGIKSFYTPLGAVSGYVSMNRGVL